MSVEIGLNAGDEIEMDEHHLPSRRLKIDGRYSDVDDVLNTLGMNTALVFRAGKNVHGEIKSVNKVTYHIRMVDPWPELQAIVVRDGGVEVAHMEIPIEEIDRMLESYGEAYVIPLDESFWSEADDIDTYAF
jgi:hypothetical protein